MDNCGSADLVVCSETGSQCTAVTDSELPLVQAGLDHREICFPHFPHKCWDQRLGPRPLLAFLLVNVTKNAQLVACKEMRVSPAQTNAGKCFRAKTRRKTKNLR